MLTEKLPQIRTNNGEESENEFTLKWDWMYGKLEKCPNRFFSKTEKVKRDDEISSVQTKFESGHKEEDLISLSTNQTMRDADSSSQLRDMEWIQQEIQSFFQRQFFLRNEVFKIMREFQKFQEELDNFNCCWKFCYRKYIREKKRDLKQKFISIRKELVQRLEQFSSKVYSKEPNLIKMQTLALKETEESNSFDRILPRSMVQEGSIQEEFHAIFQNYTILTKDSIDQKIKEQNLKDEIIFEFFITVKPRTQQQKDFQLLYNLENDQEQEYLLYAPEATDFTFSESPNNSNKKFSPRNHKENETLVSFSELTA